MDAETKILEDRSVWNVRTAQCVQDVRRTYERNDKHEETAASMGVRGSVMRLDQDTAQRLLHQAAALPDEERLFARHEGKIYIFACHDGSRRCYHGFPVDIAEMKTKRADICSLLRKHFGWAELR